MKQITTFSNSFVLQEVDGSRVINELGFRKGGLSYKIMNNNVKFYLTEDYFYKYSFKRKAVEELILTSTML